MPAPSPPSPAARGPGEGASPPSPPPGSYSTLERLLLAPLRRLGGYLVQPVIKALAFARVHPNALSLSQIPLGFVVAVLIVPFPRLALVLFIGTLVLDFLDGELARARGLASNFGALLDQVCDHVRELTVVGGLVAVGALRGEIGVAYAAAYPLANVLLYLADRFRTPLPFSVKSWMVYYPFLIAYLGWGLNLLDYAAAAAAAFLTLASVQAIWRLRTAISRSDTP